MNVFFRLSMILVFLSPALCRIAHAQQAPVRSSNVPLPVAFSQNFEGQYPKQSLADILQTLMKQGKIRVLVDGVPFKKQADFTFHGTLAAALTSVAETFDCNWNVSKSGIVLMRRRCKATGELPQIHLAEMQQMATDIHKSLRLIPFDTEQMHQYVPIDNLVASLTLEQRQALLAGARIKGSDLQPPQQQLLEEGLLTSTFNDVLPVWEETRSILAGLPFSYIEARKQSSDPASPDRLLMHITKEKGGLTRTSVLQNIGINIIGGKHDP